MKARQVYTDQGIEILVWASVDRRYPVIHHMVGSDYKLIVNESWSAGWDEC